jgi:hypothetical protein
MEITESQKNQIINRVESVLRENFNGPKSELKLHKDRLNFACPYCGDSTNQHKKRANIYWKNLIYHCYNDGCKKHTNLINFLKDYDRAISNPTDLGFYLDYIRENQIQLTSREYLELNSFQNLKKYAIPIDLIKEKEGLVSPKENMRIEKYLKSRFMHFQMEHFLYSEKTDQLYIFNLTPDKKSAFGWQIRNFGKSKNKYISYNMERMNELILNRKINLPDEELIKMNTLSLYFGIAYADFTRPVTIFEGAIDSFLVPNSIAITGADKPTDMFDDISTTRYMFDNDLAGKRVMESKLKKRKSVFMWNKLHKDFKLQPRKIEMKEIKDLNDLIEYCWKTKNEAIKKIDEYYTNNPLDLRNI